MELTDSTHRNPDPTRDVLVIDLNQVPSSSSSESPRLDALSIVRSFYEMVMGEWMCGKCMTNAVSCNQWPLGVIRLPNFCKYVVRVVPILTPFQKRGGEIPFYDTPIFDTSKYGILQIQNGLAQTPQMRWNSWNFFACNMNETVINETDLYWKLGCC